MTHHFLLNRSWQAATPFPDMEASAAVIQHLNTVPVSPTILKYLRSCGCKCIVLCVRHLQPLPGLYCPCQSLDAPPWHAQVCPLTYPKRNPSLERWSSSCSVAMDLDYQHWIKAPQQAQVTVFLLKAVIMVNIGGETSIQSFHFQKWFSISFGEKAACQVMT